jgi:hypothetical protein
MIPKAQIRSVACSQVDLAQAQMVEQVYASGEADITALAKGGVIDLGDKGALVIVGGTKSIVAMLAKPTLGNVRVRTKGRLCVVVGKFTPKQTKFGISIKAAKKKTAVQVCDAAMLPHQGDTEPGTWT